MLYQKVRPQTLNDIIGNEEVVSALKKVIKAKERPHTYLFQGPTGCGKTTLARILAKEFGCDGADLIEINAANTRGIDSIRSVAESALLAPLLSSTRCYIFDESGQLTPQAMQCLLKVIEDCPEYTYFMFCTTDPQRIIKTIRNRCAVYTVSRLRKPELQELLYYVDTLEGISADENVIDAIAETSDGSPRQALILLEQVAEIEDVAKALDYVKNVTASTKDVIDLCREIISKRADKWKRCQQIYVKLDIDVENIRRAILGYTMKVLINAQTDREAVLYAKIIEIFEKDTYSGGEASLLKMIFEACCC